MQLSDRQKKIIEIVKANEPISGDSIAQELGLTKSTLRSDFVVLTMTGILDARPKVGYIYSGLGEKSLLAETFKPHKVKDIMNQAITADPSTSVQEAITQLFMYDSGSLYVVEPDTKKLAGVVSRKDLLRSIIGQMPQTTLAVIMSRMPNIIVCQQEQTVLEAAKLISSHQVDSLPVVTPEYEVIGKISKTNIIDLLVDLSHSEA